MLWYEDKFHKFTPWRGEAIDDVVHPREIEALWSPEKLEAVRLFMPAAADPVPEGKRIVSTDVKRIDGVPKLVHVLEDYSPTLDEQYPPLEPWRFWAVVDSPGSIGEANLRNAIANHPDARFRAIAKAKLNNPPGSVFTRSDPLFANPVLQAALGVDDAMINAMWQEGHNLS